MVYFVLALFFLSVALVQGNLKVGTRYEEEGKGFVRFAVFSAAADEYFFIEGKGYVFPADLYQQKLNLKKSQVIGNVFELEVEINNRTYYLDDERIYECVVGEIKNTKNLVTLMFEPEKNGPRVELGNVPKRDSKLGEKWTMVQWRARVELTTP